MTVYIFTGNVIKPSYGSYTELLFLMDLKHILVVHTDLPQGTY